jgi:hypothetical protein
MLLTLWLTDATGIGQEVHSHFIASLTPEEHSSRSGLLCPIVCVHSRAYLKVVTITGKKFVEKPAQSFLQRFGMPMAVVGMMVVSQVLKSRSAAAQQPQQAPAQPGQPARADGNEDEDEPRFTEITEASGADRAADKKDQ